MSSDSSSDSDSGGAGGSGGNDHFEALLKDIASTVPVGAHNIIAAFESLKREIEIVKQQQQRLISILFATVSAAPALPCLQSTAIRGTWPRILSMAR